MEIESELIKDGRKLNTKEEFANTVNMSKNSPAVVFGLYETGLGVIRSLGQVGIKITGIDYRKDIGWYSRYVKPLKCPHPLLQENEFIDWVNLTFSSNEQKLPVFLTSDDFLISFSRNREVLKKYFIFNLIEHSALESITNKYSQFQLVTNAGVNSPLTWVINSLSDTNNLPEDISFPVFIKGLDVNLWRTYINAKIKGFLVNNLQELNEKLKVIIEKKVPVILQEVIVGPDTNHFKYCCYITGNGEILGEFTLQKIRQKPIHFGVGSAVKSIHKPDLIEIGRKLFTGIDYKGIGSAEFKLDNRDGKLKLIEINPRYWQQNYLSTYCGMNFPLLNYLDLIKNSPKTINTFISDIKWVNRYLDFDSFINYRKEGTLTFRAWRKSLRGKIIYPDFTWDDPIPAFYEIGYKISRFPRFLWNNLTK